MKWQGRRQSDNMEDRRGMSTTGKAAVGGGMIGIIFLLIQVFLGGDSAALLGELQNQIQTNTTQTTERELTEAEVLQGQFVSTVLADTEDVWNKIFQERGLQYKEPKLVLFNGGVKSACGGASSSSGPFYCPADETVYMDLDFFQELVKRFGAKGGDFAIAYVIAHEVGHHVQKQLGVLSQVHQYRQTASKADGNRAYVAMELQADFYAGVWAHHVKKYLDEKDFEEALSAAAAVGDDTIQKKTQGYVVPETFTHGTSEQRMYWLTRGFQTGDIAKGDTFKEVE